MYLVISVPVKKKEHFFSFYSTMVWCFSSTKIERLICQNFAFQRSRFRRQTPRKFGFYRQIKFHFTQYLSYDDRFGGLYMIMKCTRSLTLFRAAGTIQTTVLLWFNENYVYLILNFNSNCKQIKNNLRKGKPKLNV